MIMLSIKGIHLLNTKRVFIILVCCVLTSCANEPSVNPKLTESSQWDFDHQLQYKQTRLSVSTYQLNVLSSNKVSFERQSAFLLRRAYIICGNYGYQLELLKGIESFDHQRASPNLILANLTAKLDCPSK
mgnify:CR=1 FL=1